MIVSPPSPEWMKMEEIAPPKRRILQDPHDLTSRRTAFFIVTAVKT
jgi:hypothetical protein